jgi:5-(carboxyamino)imidazole ribonucleotide synthase
MIAIAAANLGYKTHIYCPDKGSPAFQVTTEYTMLGYTDKVGLASFASKCDVITYEFENIPRETIDFLETYTPVRYEFSLKFPRNFQFFFSIFFRSIY